MKDKLFIKTRYIAFTVEKRHVLILFTLMGILTVSFLTSVAIGRDWYSLWSLFDIFIGNGDPMDSFIVFELRLPRVVLALLVGSAFGIAGAILQGIVRNPLASPEILGITGGAAVFSVAFIVFFSGSVAINWLPLFSFIGALMIAILIYALSWKKGITPLRMILLGIGFQAATGALTTMMIVLGSMFTATQAYLWLTGSIYAATWDDIRLILPWLFVLIPIGLLLGKAIDVLTLGDRVAKSLGVKVNNYRFLLLVVSAALTGVAVAIGGGIGFVGLIAPHIAKRLVGHSFVPLAITSSLLGSLIVLIADTFGRTAFSPLDVPVGVFTAGFGAPFFIYLLYRNRHHIN
ncbi:FecCD family ABC transporter permease [Salirhabdus salicampi]|uniref:FecCD family ABC transporter permease n=1 Tax=Salirhabdus salicampi TaxID=476102 RepID=UPI0020C5A528|nr:iron ABC transporter permease [Salirhabdus salicampi]MCP8615352.1 iron ABC transporter permease [Salirhabdus salicampi]